MEEQQVILVDEHDKEYDSMGKMEAHKKGLLHRAFSIFIFNSKGEMLLQQRALQKYHSGGLWTNACCSHPQPGDVLVEAAGKRLMEEMGFTTKLEKAFDFVYRTDFDNGLTEHEFDHVFVGEYDDKVSINPEEVTDFCYKTMEDIRYSLQTHPQKYTAWFRLAFPMITDWWEKHYK